MVPTSAPSSAPGPDCSFASHGSHLGAVNEELTKRLAAVGGGVHIGRDLGRGRSLHNAVNRRGSGSMAIADPSKVMSWALSSMRSTTSLGNLNPGSNGAASADAEAGVEAHSWPDSPGRTQQKQLSRRVTAMLDRAVGSGSGPQNNPPSCNECGSPRRESGGQMFA